MSNMHIYTNPVTTKQFNSDKKFILSVNTLPCEELKIFVHKKREIDLTSAFSISEIFVEELCY